MPSTSTIFKTIHARLLERKLVSMRNSKIHGIGVYANVRIAPGRVLARYEGKILTAAGVKRELSGGNPYLLELPDGTVLDGSTGRGPGRFFNHSCDPSARFEYREGVPLIASTRAIERGEEITIDYGFDPTEITRFPCACRKPSCVGYIVGWPYHAMVRQLYGSAGNAHNAGIVNQ
jgi:SET domain-containing protein